MALTNFHFRGNRQKIKLVIYILKIVIEKNKKRKETE